MRVTTKQYHQDAKAQGERTKLRPLLQQLLLAGVLGPATGGLAMAAEPADPVPAAGPAAAAAAEAGAPRSDAPVLNEVTVKASGLGLTSADMSTPATVLEGDVLTLRQAATLGETLDGEPGIHGQPFRRRRKPAHHPRHGRAARANPQRWLRAARCLHHQP